jgi:hypothetical protein
MSSRITIRTIVTNPPPTYTPPLPLSPATRARGIGRDGLEGFVFMEGSYPQRRSGKLRQIDAHARPFSGASSLARLICSSSLARLSCSRPNQNGTI